MYICHRYNNRHYQRLRAEHIAAELRALPPGLDDESPPPKETELTRQREASAKLHERYGQLFGLTHSRKVVPWLDDWAVLERTAGPAERHDYLESFLRRVQSQPEAHAAEITFLLAIFEPLRVSMMHALRDAKVSDPSELSAIPRHRREEAKMLAHVASRSRTTSKRKSFGWIPTCTRFTKFGGWSAALAAARQRTP